MFLSQGRQIFSRDPPKQLLRYHYYRYPKIPQFIRIICLLLSRLGFGGFTETDPIYSSYSASLHLNGLIPMNYYLLRTPSLSPPANVNQPFWTPRYRYKLKPKGHCPSMHRKKRNYETAKKINNFFPLMGKLYPPHTVFFNNVPWMNRIGRRSANVLVNAQLTYGHLI